MSLLTVGINHNSASVDLREKVSFVPEQMDRALKSLSDHLGGCDTVILSTCNRTELFLDTDGDTGSVLQWLADFHQVSLAELANCYYAHKDEDAARHLMQVAAGLDSLVLGEPQIFGQIKSAYAQAVEAGTVTGPLHHALQHVFTVAKRVRAETAIGHNPVSVAFAAVRLAEQIFGQLSGSTALVLGAGKTIELVVRHLKERGVAKIIIANRTLARAQALSDEVGAEAILLGEIPEKLHLADIVIASTASQLPVLGKGAVEQALKRRKHKPMLMVDIAVPRDIEPQVADLRDVYLYTVDHLKDVIDEGLRAREQAAAEARALVEEGVAAFQQSRQQQSVAARIVALREQALAWREQELERAQKALARGEDAAEVMARLAHNLTNKLLHTPTQMLKQQSLTGVDALDHNR